MSEILAIVTKEEKKAGGGVPIFYARDEEEFQQTSHLLEKILDAMAHDLKNGTMILVQR
ncbi:capping complex subunit for YIEGIA [Paenibacillus swuensis]|uniref:capping complex subunit for YIEGIA n=1 Tax=Paenibacillus swuensis TaxID=1178515 RepID=UPI000AB2EF11|nr:hypothetical protein [Paenibacillus swuensis]